MSLGLQPLDPVVDVGDVRGLDRADRIGRDRAQPLAEAVPLLLDQEAFRVALVDAVREQQRHHVLAAADLGRAGFARPVAQQLDAVLALLKPLVKRLQLRLAQLVVGVVEAVLGRDQPRQLLGCRAHGSRPSRVPSPD